MASNSEIWKRAASRYRDALQSAWLDITIDGKSIEEKWGLSRQICDQYSVGFIPLFDNFYDEVLEKEFGIDLPALHAANGFELIALSSSNFTWRENRFMGRIVFPFWKNDEVIYWSARDTDILPDTHWSKPAPQHEYGSKWKHLTLGEDEVRPFYLEPDPKELCIVVEQPPAALRLRQEGFLACATCGVLTHAQVNQLKHCDNPVFLPDVDVLAPTPDATSTDANGNKRFVTGKSTADKIALLLGRWRNCKQMTLAQYPAPFCEANPKGDINDWFLKNSDPKNFATNVLSNRLTLDMAEIQSIDKYLPADKKFAAITDWLRRIYQRPGFETNPLVNHLAQHLGLDKEQTKSVRAELKKLQQHGLENRDDIRDFSEESKMVEIRAGQDWVHNELIYTVWRSQQRKFVRDGKVVTDNVDIPFQVTSSGDFFAATTTEMAARYMRFPRDSEPNFATYRWSIDPGAPYSLHNYLRNPLGTDPPSWELYNDLINYLQEFAYYEDDNMYDFLALHIMSSYLVMLFGGLGILALNGTKNSGKSRTLELIESVGFNAIKVSSASGSYLYRIVDTTVATFCWDETESLSSKSKVNDQTEDKSIILKDCYRRSGGVGRCIGTENRPKKFRSYATFNLANTQGIEATLRSRCHFVPTNRAPKDKVKAWTEHRTRHIWQSLRDRLYCWSLRHAKDVSENYDRLEVGNLEPLLNDLKLYNRDREINSPLIAIALTLDRLVGSPFDWTPQIPNWTRTPTTTTITGRLIAAIQGLTKLKHELLLSDDLTPTFLAALRQVIKEKMIPSEIHPGIADPTLATGWYETNELRKILNTFIGLKYFPRKSGPNSIKFFLRDKVKILRPEDITRWRTGGKQPTFIRIDMERLSQACKTHEVEDDAWIELEEVTPAKSSSTDEGFDLDSSDQNG